MDPLDDVALLQIAILQQDLLERDVEKARKKKEEEKTQKISDPSMAGRGEEEAVLTLRQTDGGAQSRRRLRSSTTSGMEPAMFDELVQRVGPRTEKQDTNMRKSLPRQA